MTAPLSDARLTEIREVYSQWGGYAIDADRVSKTFAAVRELLGEVERLRAQLAERTDFLAEVNYQRERALGERDQARAELATAHADALNRGAAVLDRLADTAEAKVLEHYNGACGKGSCDLVRESARTLREMAGTHTAPTA